MGIVEARTVVCRETRSVPGPSVPQPEVELYTRNVGHGQHAGGSREAPGGNKGRCESTQRQSIATMGGHNDGSKMVFHGYGLDDDWTMVLGMCSLEMESLNADSCQGKTLSQDQHHKMPNNWSSVSCHLITGSCLTDDRLHHSGPHRLHSWASAFRTSICIVATMYLVI